MKLRYNLMHDSGKGFLFLRGTLNVCGVRKSKFAIYTAAKQPIFGGYLSNKGIEPLSESAPLDGTSLKNRFLNVKVLIE